MSDTAIHLARYTGRRYPVVESAWRQAKRQATMDGHRDDYLVILRYTMKILNLRAPTNLPSAVGDTVLVLLGGRRSGVVEAVEPHSITVRFEAGLVTLPLISLLFILVEP